MMNRPLGEGRLIMKKTGLLIVGAAISLVMAAPAHADMSDFISYLQRQGEAEPGTEFEAGNLGHAICDMFDAGGTTSEVMRTLHQTDNATWVVGSIHYLCPQYLYLLN
jgi:hypothetical protein